PRDHPGDEERSTARGDPRPRHVDEGPRARHRAGARGGSRRLRREARARARARRSGKEDSRAPRPRRAGDRRTRAPQGPGRLAAPRPAAVIVYRSLVLASLAVGGVLTALAVGIVFNKARREARTLADRRRREALEPRILAAIHADPRDAPSGSLPEKPFRLAVGSVPHGRDARVVEGILAHHAVRLPGVARDRISQAFEELGFVDRYLEGLGASWWWRRADSAERLGLARATRAIDALVARMEDPVAEVRMRAAKSLGEIRGRAAVRPLV